MLNSLRAHSLLFQGAHNCSVRTVNNRAQDFHYVGCRYPEPVVFDGNDRCFFKPRIELRAGTMQYNRHQAEIAQESKSRRQGFELLLNYATAHLDDGETASRLGIKIIQHQHGADPSAVLFDAVQYAEAHKSDAVLADTAGRFHNRVNLMNQLDKIRRVMKPDLIVYVDEAVAGNDAVVRAFEFEKTVGAEAVVLTKADMDPKGGAAISIAHTIGKPLMFLGTGQGYDDIVPFSGEKMVDDLLSGAA